MIMGIDAIWALVIAASPILILQIISMIQAHLATKRRMLELAALDYNMDRRLRAALSPI